MAQRTEDDAVDRGRAANPGAPPAADEEARGPAAGEGTPHHEAVRRPDRQPGAPSSPLDIGAHGWRDTVRRVQKRLVRDRVSLSAGSLAYHWFLALFPAVVAVIGFLTIVHVSHHRVDSIVNGLNKALPPGVSGVFAAAVHAATSKSSGSTTAIVIGIAVAVWSASGGMSALEQALDIAYEVPVDRKFVARRVRAVPLMAATLILGGISAALIIFGAPLGSWVQHHVHLSGVAFTVAWTVVRWVAAIVAMSLLFSFFYYLGPNRETPRWQWVSAGGLIGTLICLVASLGFSFYVTSFGSYGKTYGPFAGVAILIFWLYLTGFAVLLGGEMNAEIEREAAAEGGNQEARATARSELEQPANVH